METSAFNQARSSEARRNILVGGRRKAIDMLMKFHKLILLVTQLWHLGARSLDAAKFLFSISRREKIPPFFFLFLFQGKYFKETFYVKTLINIWVFRANVSFESSPWNNNIYRLKNIYNGKIQELKAVFFSKVIVYVLLKT